MPCSQHLGHSSLIVRGGRQRRYFFDTRQWVAYNAPSARTEQDPLPDGALKTWVTHRLSFFEEADKVDNFFCHRPMIGDGRRPTRGGQRMAASPLHSRPALIRHTTCHATLLRPCCPAPPCPRVLIALHHATSLCSVPVPVQLGCRALFLLFLSDVDAHEMDAPRDVTRVRQPEGRCSEASDARDG